MNDLLQEMSGRTRARRHATAIWSAVMAACAYANVHLAASVQDGEINDLGSILSSLVPSTGPILVVAACMVAWGGLFALSAWCNKFVASVDEWENDVSNDRRFPSWNIAESLSTRLGIPTPIIVHDRMSWYEAAAFRLHGFQKISLSRNLLLDADYDEMEAVIAHELSHIVRNDHLLRAVNQAWVAGALIASAWAVSAGLIGIISHSPIEVAGMVGAMALSVAFGIAALLSFFAALRSQEYTADMDAAIMTGNPEPLMDYLEYLGSFAPPRPKSLLRTHPTVEERMAALNRWGQPSACREAVSSY